MNEVKSKIFHSFAPLEVQWNWPSRSVFRQRRTWNLQITEESGEITRQDTDPNFWSFGIKNCPQQWRPTVPPGGHPHGHFLAFCTSELWTTSHLNFWKKISSAWERPWSLILLPDFQTKLSLKPSNWVRLFFCLQGVWPHVSPPSQGGRGILSYSDGTLTEQTMETVTWQNAGWGSPFLLQAGLNVSQINSDKVSLAFDFRECVKIA